jgi:carbon-monoxide dehydrogenase medium subunit
VASIEGLATVQIRHKASVVGNLCNASPCADTATPLMALGARAVVVGPDSSREIPVEALIVGPGENSLGEFEIVHNIIVPPPREHQRSLFLKHSPRSKVDIAAVSVCISMLVRDGKRPGTELLSRAAAAAREECSPITDLRASEEHRRHMTGILIYRGLEQLTVQK